MKKNIKTLICVLLFILILGSSSVYATTIYSEHIENPCYTYTYIKTNSGLKAVYSKPMFNSAKSIDCADIGVEKFSALSDISVSNGKIFLLDSEQSRVVVLNADYTLYADYQDISGEKFIGAKGIYATKDCFYISDTDNARVLVCSLSGTLIRKIILPDSPLIPDNFKFRPIKTAVDSKGYTYILSDGSYYGAILYSPNGEFLGFYGSNTVTTSISDMISSVWEKITTTNDKKSKQASKLPYQFTDLYLDNENFVYTSTGKTKDQELQTGVIRKLSPSGINILPSNNISFGEQEIPSSGNTYALPTQSIDGLCVDKDGFIYMYDSSYGKIYVYDKECNMLNAFGGGLGYGKQEGLFVTISGIDILDNDLLVIDGTKNNITVYTITEYGKLLKQAQMMTLVGDYSNSKSLWKQIYAQDNNSQLALIGLAKAAYSEGDYRVAMSYAKQGFDQITYSDAFVHIRTEFLHNYFGIFLSVIIVLIVAVWFLIKQKQKKNITFIKKRETLLLSQVVMHPAATFMSLKQNGGWSSKFALIILVLYYISESLKSMFGGFVFTSSDSGSFNSILLLVKTFGFVILWAVANWGVCALLGGIGKFKEIFCVITYSLIPMIFSNILYIVLTNCFVREEIAFLSVLTTALQMYTILIVIIGSIIIHDFSFGKFIGTTVLTFLGMLIVIFVGVIMIILVQQLVAFFATVYQEFVYK